MYIRCICVLITKYVSIVHYVYWVYVCVFCTLSSVQSCKYVLSICKLFLQLSEPLSRILLTKALVLWSCDNKSDLIWFNFITYSSNNNYNIIIDNKYLTPLVQPHIQINPCTGAGHAVQWDNLTYTSVVFYSPCLLVLWMDWGWTS